MDDSVLKTDVLIVGSGPAACAAGLVLVRAGYSVTLIERTTQYARPQFGECLSASGLPALRELGLEQTFYSQAHLSMQAYRVQWGEHEIHDKHLLANTAGTGWLLNREHFDRMFIDSLRELGVNIFWQTSLENIEANIDDSQSWKVEVKNSNERRHIRASILVDASGRARAVARRLGAKTRKLDRLVTFSCRLQHNINQLPAQNVVIVSDQHGWWYSAPYAKNLSSLNYFTDGDLPLPENTDVLLAQAQNLPALREVLKEVSVIPSPHRQTTAAYSSTLDHCAGAKWIAVGDAACSYDPLSSYGISSAIGSGIYGANALIDAQRGEPLGLLKYQDMMRTTFLHYLESYQAEYARVTNSSSAFWARRGCY